MQVELSEASINYLLNLLAKQPWFEADPPLQEIRAAVNAFQRGQFERRMLAERHTEDPKPNGSAAALG
jgi:hypothetical protein